MGFLRKNNTDRGRELGTTVISQGTTFVGELNLEANLHIDGTFEGTITSSSDVSIGAAGHFEGTITAKRMLVSGYVKGQVECDRLEIIETGKVFGEVVSDDFVIEPGGRFVGGSRDRGDGPVAALSHLKDSGKRAGRSAATADASDDSKETASAGSDRADPVVKAQPQGWLRPDAEESMRSSGPSAMTGTDGEDYESR